MVEKSEKKQRGRTGLSRKDGWVLCEVCKECACIYEHALRSLYPLSRPTCCVEREKKGRRKRKAGRRPRKAREEGYSGMEAIKGWHSML